MDNFEIDEILKSFRIIVDTREQTTARASRRIRQFGCHSERATMNYGDYSANITLPTGELLDVSKRISPACVIERKMSLDELAGCLTRDRERFRREFERAAEAGAKVFLLTEGGSWEKILHHQYRSKFNPNAFLASVTAWSVRYNIVPLFCSPEYSGKLIREILYRDMKERLAKGEFDAGR